MSYLLILLLIGLLIFVHELGHFAAARLMRIPVRRLSVGFGPKILGFKKNKTEFWLSAMPLGGYVLPQVESPQDFHKFSIKQRLVFSCGGPLANVIVALVLLAILNMLSSTPTIYGLLIEPFIQVADATWRLLALIPKMISHPDELSGIFGIIAGGGQIPDFSLEKIAGFSVLLSLNLAVFNLLPILPLDGGKMLLCSLEKLMPQVARLHAPLALTGWGALLAIFVYLAVQDIGRLIR